MTTNCACVVYASIFISVRMCMCMHPIMCDVVCVCVCVRRCAVHVGFHVHIPLVFADALACPRCCIQEGAAVA